MDADALPVIRKFPENMHFCHNDEYSFSEWQTFEMAALVKARLHGKDCSYVAIPKVRNLSLDFYSKWHVVEKITFTAYHMRSYTSVCANIRI